MWKRPEDVTPVKNRKYMLAVLWHKLEIDSGYWDSGWYVVNPQTGGYDLANPVAVFEVPELPPELMP